MYDNDNRRWMKMCKTKLLSVRIEEELYDKIAKSPLGISGFTRQSVIQSLNGKKTRQEKKLCNTPNEDVIQNYKQQVELQSNQIDHLNSEIMYLRELHQTTMNRVLQLPENAGYNRDPIKDMRNTVSGAVKDQSQANIITKLGNIITDYKNNTHGLL